MDPEYFHRVLTFGEADDFLAGLHRRYRHGYCQARMVADVIGQLFAKNYKSPVFGWEEEERRHSGSRPPTEEELREIMEEARKWEEELNEGRGPLPSPPTRGGSGYTSAESEGRK